MAARTKTPRGLDLQRTFLHFTKAHGIDAYRAGPKFWADLTGGKLHLDGRLVGSVRLRKGALDHWEMHPKGDEFLMLLSGAMTLVLEQRGGKVSRIRMKQGQACIVPKSLWHTFEIASPGELMFATAGEGTEHRPVARGKARA